MLEDKLQEIDLTGEVCSPSLQWRLADTSPRSDCRYFASMNRIEFAIWAPTASERRRNNLKRFKDVCLNAKARVWP